MLPHILCRYVDDIFCAFDSKDEMDKFFHNLNKVHSSVSFSKEVEADGQLTYLDVLLTKKMRKELKQLSIEKNTHIGLYNKWKACRQCNIKSAIQSLLHRSYQICSSYQLTHKEFQHIKSCFLSNGYLDWFIDRQIKIFLNKRYKTLLQKTSKKGRLIFEEFFYTCLALVKHQYN